MKEKRDRSRDGVIFKIQFYLMTHFKWFWKLIMKNDTVRRPWNRFLISLLINKADPRPNPYTTKSPYTTWDSLTDRTYKGRYLPPVSDEKIKSLPPIDDVVKLFERRDGKELYSDKSSQLLGYFAVWFFEPIVNTDPTNYLKSRSTHQVDLIAVYGRTEEIAHTLRTHVNGKLKSQIINGEEYPPYYFENGKVKDEFKDLELVLFDHFELPKEKKEKLFAMGLAKGNRQIGTMLFSTLYLREHNRICDILRINYPSWDDERIFQTARNIMTVIHLKIVVEEYINVINPFFYQAWADPFTFKTERWLRPNWVTFEFDLLYRWHSLMPESIKTDDGSVGMHDFIGNTDLLTQRGLGYWFETASKNPSGKIGVHNTHKFLLGVERASIQLGRDAKAASFNDYREIVSLPRYTEFNQMTADKELQEELRKLYGHPDNVEFYVGIFAEDPWERDLVPNTMRLYLAIDALSQVYTNPILSPRVYNENTFSPIGMEIINKTKNVEDLVNRNTPSIGRPYKVSMGVGERSKIAH